MAVISQKQCIKCHNSFNAINSQTVCNNCTSVATTQKRKIHFDALDQLSVEERLRKVEKWIYDYKPSENSLNTKY